MEGSEPAVDKQLPRVARPSSTMSRRVFIALYGLLAIPVIGWCMFNLYAIAKSRYEGEAVGPMVPSLLLALIVPLIWAVGVVGAVVLARLGKRWTVWATVFVIPLALIVAYLVGTFAMAFINFPLLS